MPCKGLDENNYVTELVTADLAWLGHTALVLKADNEASLQAVVRATIRRATATCTELEKISKEEPAKYESQSNGLTEVGILIIRGLFRTMRLCLESRVQRKIPVGHALVPWLLEHACLVLNTTSVGPDGQTAWQRVRGRPFTQRLIAFGEKSCTNCRRRSRRQPRTAI